MTRFISAMVIAAVVGVLFAGPALAFQCPKLIGNSTPRPAIGSTPRATTRRRKRLKPSSCTRKASTQTP